MNSSKIIPFVDLKLQYEIHKEKFEGALLEASASGQYILGDEVSSFEKKFAKFLQVGHAIGVASGTDALTLSCLALGLGSGDEVLVPANTFIASALGVYQLGAKLIPVDIDPDTYLMDMEHAKRLLTQHTKAVIPVHLYGRSMDMSLWMDFAKRNGLHVIEDACQAHGAKWKKKRLGGFGTFGCFSFFPSKNLGAFGDGGMVVTNDPGMAEKIRLLRNYGSVKKYVHQLPGMNSRLDSLQAAILNIKLDLVDKWNKDRFHAACRYAEGLEKNSSVRVNDFDRSNSESHVFHLFVIECDRRDQLMEYLFEHGVQCGVHYPVPIYLHSAFSKFSFERGLCPVAEKKASRILSLPMFPEITKDQIDRVIEVLRAFHG